jgi:uncharacterized protein (TIGR00725 family)
MKKTITVFGSSIPVEGDKEYAAAYKLGCLLGQKGFDVNTGGYAGIMEAVSKGVVENGGKATGITLQHINSSANRYLTEEIKCKTLFERITELIQQGDAYVILQGGTGTLLELAAVWEFMNKNFIGVKPVACHSLMWKEIGAVVDKQIEREKRVSGLVKYFDDVEDIVKYLVKEVGKK